jgi:hypothetical protein
MVGEVHLLLFFAEESLKGGQRPFCYIFLHLSLNLFENGNAMMRELMIMVGDNVLSLLLLFSFSFIV